MAEERKALTLRLPKSLLKAVDEAVLASDLDRHAWIVVQIERGLEEPVDPDLGPVEKQTKRDIEALVSSHPMGEALAAGALSLARVLDRGAGMATAAVSREWRATLIELAKYEQGSVDDDDGAPDLSATALGDAEDDDETDAW